MTLAFPKNPPLRDNAYRRHARECGCDVPSCYANADSVVLAHIRIAGNCGMGMKPPDDESFMLCADHHREYDTAPDRNEWVVRNIVIPWRRGVYQRWRVTK